MDTITRDELKEKLDNDEVTLLNVLGRENFEEQHIPGSINIPMDRLEDEARERLDKDNEIVVYCASEGCQASPKAAKMLEEMGFSNVKDYEGGMNDWVEAGLDVASA